MSQCGKHDEDKSNESSNNKTVKDLITKRAVVKRRITGIFQKAAQVDNPNIPLYKQSIEEYLREICALDNNICDLMSSEELDEDCIKEIDNQTNYHIDIRQKVSELYNSSSDSVIAKVSATTDCRVQLPDLKCDYFTGEGTSVLQYHAFISQFNNIVGLRSNLTDGTKFTYLKNYLKGYALKLVQHLHVSDENYPVALNLLNKEFLNKDALVDNLLKKLFDLKPKFDTTYLETKVYINEVRCVLSDLKLYDVDFAGFAGDSLISNVVFHKLPNTFKQELVRKTAKQYPKLSDIFANYVEVVHTLTLRESINKVKDKFPSQNTAKESHKPVMETSILKSGTVNNDKIVRNCKFCTCSGHTMLNCKKYPDHASRVTRCKFLKVCESCTSKWHTKSECNKPLDFNCYICKSTSHISALCPKYTAKINTNVCLNSASNSGQTFLLPVMTVTVGALLNQTKVKCLIDTGSQRSYLSGAVLDRVGEQSNCNDTNVLINTFIDSSVKNFSESCLNINFNEGSTFPVPFLVNRDFNLDFTIDGLQSATSNIGESFKLLEKFNSDNIKLEGLLGVDCIQYLRQCDVVSCLGGKALKLYNGVVPFGNIDSFLNSHQLTCKYSKSSLTVVDSSNLLNAAECDSKGVDRSIVNFVMNPIKTNFDPLGGVITDSLVEHNLDRMFNVESLGITEESSDYDKEKIAEFTETIRFDNGKYNIEIPWTEKIQDVKSNFSISKTILDKVVTNLHAKNLYNDYAAVLNQQLSDEILEPVSLNYSKLHEHIFIPHRPVIKTAENVTTKVRIVLNCSLKVDDTPSLNEAAYSGVDLINNLLELLLKVRAHKYFVSSDIKQAYLNIKLTKEEDRNKFTILWIDTNGELVAYRYKAIVFGFCSSPFILHHIINHHLQQYSDDQCNYLLKNNMYIDNLFITANEISYLYELYQESCRRMTEGGFELRSWVSNSEELAQKFADDDSGSKHNCQYEKVLGYKYFPNKDKFQLSNI